MRKKGLLKKLRLCGIFNGLDDSYLNAVEKGMSCAQFRIKGANSLDSLRLIKAKMEYLIRKGITVLINDRIDVAFTCNAHGVHIGKGDFNVHTARAVLGRHRIIGKTVRDVNEAVGAQEEGADYVSVGPIFRTDIKRTLRPVGLKMLSAVKDSVKIPVTAIGGINFLNVRRVMDTGADGVWMMSAFREA